MSRFQSVRRVQISNQRGTTRRYTYASFLTSACEYFCAAQWIVSIDREAIAYLGITTSHRRRQRFGIRQADRLSHMLALGKTGTGKSTLLETLVRQDMAAGRGFALIDPHGDLADRVYAGASPEERERLVYLDAPDPAQPYGYNPLRRVRDDKIPLAASGLLETFRKLWPAAWGVRMEHVLRNSLYTLLEREGSTLPDILRLYRDAAFRRSVVAGGRNDVVRAFWREEFDRYTERAQAEMVGPIANKLGALLVDPLIYRVLVTPKRDLHLRNLMDSGQGLVMNLSKGHIGEDAATLLGSILVSTLGLAAFSRADQAPVQRRPFFIYVDEFQTFTTLAFVNMMSELRKHGAGLMLASQYLDAVPVEVRKAVLGNVGTLISFRVGPEDAGLLAREFQPVFGVEDLLNLPHRHFYVRLMIDGTPSRAFSGQTLDR